MAQKWRKSGGKHKMQTQSKYNLNDLVYSLDLNTFVHIIEVRFYEFLGVSNEYKIKYNDIEMWVVEDKLTDNIPTFNPPKSLAPVEYKGYIEYKDGSIKKNPFNYCDCGAWATEFPDIHSKWCRS